MNRVDKKVLIIPSWYPTISNPLVGSFFKEQAELVEDCFDIKVLYGIKKKISKRKFFFNKILEKGLGANIVYSRKITQIPTPPVNVQFEYDYIPDSKAEQKNYFIMLTAYERELNELINKNWKPDLIHAQSTVFGGIIAAYLGKKFNIPVIITEHQAFLLHWYSRFLQDRLCHAMEYANLVLAVSHHQKRCILMNNIQCNPYIIGNYINEALFPLLPKETFSCFKVMTITYPSFLKDPETFFKGIATLVKKGHKDISVTVIGNNSFENLNEANVNEFQILAEKYNVLKYCNLVSYVEREKLINYFQEHHVFVSTSVAETFGVAICEALATGIPVVSTKNGGVDDIIGEDNGIKINIKDYEALADALIKIKTKEIQFDPNLLRKSVVDTFGKTSFKKRLTNIYNAVINEYDPSSK